MPINTPNAMQSNENVHPVNQTFKARFWRIGKWFILLFVLLFCFRLLYGYVVVDIRSNHDYSDNFFGSIDNLRKNYASEKIELKGGEVQVASHLASNQKYEKTASLKTKTSEFEKDEQTLKAKTKAFKAVIQYEQSLGQKGNRQIHLLIGVNPTLFDSLYMELKKIGVLKATEITKVDKTNEYRELNAKKASIEKTLQSLNELKSKGGAISDFVALNDKILEIEERAQDLGVELGNFDTENEFCTVKLSMYEGATEKNIPFIQRVKVALEWTVKYFAILVFSTFVVSILVLALLVLVEKSKILIALNKKMSE
jgi:hypothetical protein